MGLLRWSSYQTPDLASPNRSALDRSMSRLADQNRCPGVRSISCPQEVSRFERPKRGNAANGPACKELRELQKFISADCIRMSSLFTVHGARDSPADDGAACNSLSARQSFTELFTTANPLYPIRGRASSGLSILAMWGLRRGIFFPNLLPRSLSRQGLFHSTLLTWL